jgi:hypothetical protein
MRAAVAERVELAAVAEHDDVLAEHLARLSASPEPPAGHHRIPVIAQAELRQARSPHRDRRPETAPHSSRSPNREVASTRLSAAAGGARDVPGDGVARFLRASHPSPGVHFNGVSSVVSPAAIVARGGYCCGRARPALPFPAAGLCPEPQAGQIHPALGLGRQQPLHLCRQGHGLLGESTGSMSASPAARGRSRRRRRSARTSSISAWPLRRRRFCKLSRACR